MGRWSKMFLRLSQARLACAALIAAVPVLAGLAAFSIRGVPRPIMHDEFAYLFAADTFAHGRLANPAHPLWKHFESFDLLMRPTMSSRKPPGQGLFLALGQVVFGRPIAGVLLSVAAACAAIYWMLLAFVEPPWALLGGLLAALHPEVAAWTESYWGGGVALLGGALALGAWKRLLDRPSLSSSAAFGLGLAVLANSRPFEGLVLAAPLALWLAWRTRGRWAASLSPAAVVLALAASWMALLNYRVTGSPAQFPYTLYERAYDPAPLLIWQPIGPNRTYANKEFDEYFNHWELDGFAGQDTAAGYPRFLVEKWSRLAGAWLQPFPVKLLFAAAPFGLAPPALTGLLAALVLGITMPVRATTYAYYSAPLGGLFFALLVLLLRRVFGWMWRGRDAGRALVFAAVAWALVNSLGQYWLYARAKDNSWSIIKEDARRRLEALPGRHLVLVGYEKGHSVHQEWVYNAADLESSRVIWARSLSPADDAALADFYPGRSVWDLRVAARQVRFSLRRAGR